MPLVQCIDCGKMVSDKAKHCIQCGCPLEEILKDKKTAENNNIKVTYKKMKKCKGCELNYVEDDEEYCPLCVARAIADGYSATAQNNQNKADNLKEYNKNESRFYSNFDNDFDYYQNEYQNTYYEERKMFDSSNDEWFYDDEDDYDGLGIHIRDFDEDF